MDLDLDWLDYHDPDYPIDDGRDDDNDCKNKPVDPDSWANKDLDDGGY